MIVLDTHFSWLQNIWMYNDWPADINNNDVKCRVLKTLKSSGYMLLVHVECRIDFKEIENIRRIFQRMNKHAFS